MWHTYFLSVSLNVRKSPSKSPATNKAAFWRAFLKLTAWESPGERAESAAGDAIDTSLGVETDNAEGDEWFISCGKWRNNALYGRFQFMKVLVVLLAHWQILLWFYLHRITGNPVEGEGMPVSTGVRSKQDSRVFRLLLLLLGFLKPDKLSRIDRSRLISDNRP